MTRNPIPTASPRDIATIDLNQVLTRLEHKILSADADPRLQHSSYERSKTSVNLEYARTLLLRLEHDTSTIKIQSRKAAAQSSLTSQRALIKRLTDRLHDLDRTGDDDDLLHGPEDEEDILNEALPPPSPPSQPPPPTDPSPLPPAPNKEPTSTTTTTTYLRNRLHPSSSSPTSPPTTTTLLESQDSETASLTSSLLSLAQALKKSSAQFGDSLAADTETLGRATEGLDKNATGMEAAGRRMGLLKRMSEGQGWWGRMMLYAWIGGLWVVAIGVVFVGPKLRF